MNNTIVMPKLRPVPIKTKGLPWWKQLWIWLTSFRKWELLEDYILFIPWLNVAVKIPKGFIFDGASIPRFLWPLLSPTGILFIPGLFHDYGYKYNKWLNLKGESIFIDKNRNFFDKQFGKLGDYINDMPIIDKVAYTALNIFGWLAWYKHRKKDKK